jgi:peroxiredoxin Q/BCP
MKWLIALLLSSVVAFGQASIKEGDAAPNWTLEGSDGNSYQLSDLRGTHVVLAFFPKAFTGGCTIECKSIRDSKRQVRRFEVQLFMASTDDIETAVAFAEQNNANFPILADASQTVSDAYGVLGSGGMAKRWTFYIDAEGIISKIDKNVNPRTAGRQLLENLIALEVPVN